MHIQVKSFISLLRRYPLPILGNVLGLAVALAVFIIISMETNYNRTYDHHIKDVERIYRLFIETSSTGTIPTSSRPLCEQLFRQSPHIEAGTFRNVYTKLYYNVGINGIPIKTDACTVASNYFDFFGFDWVTCDTTTFTDPNARFVAESVALRFYDTTDLLRKPLSPDDPSTYIGGIYRDFPENSSVINAIYAYMGDENKDDIYNFNYCCYFKLFDARDRATAEQILDESNTALKDQGINGFSLLPYIEQHFRQDIQTDTNLKGVDPDTQYLFLFIALLIITIACINFTNLYASLCPLRIRSINTCKVLGATRAELFRNLVTETTLVCIVAWGAALGLVVLAARLGMGELQHATIDLGAHPVLTAGSFGLALVMGFVSGIYPALYATSFQPALVLKGNFGLSPKGRSLRNVLIGIQFTTAFALFICVLNVWQQNDYMRHSELGYNQNRLINISIKDIPQTEGGTQGLIDGLKQLAAVEHVATCFMRLSSPESGLMQWTKQIDHDTQNIAFACLPVSHDFLHTAGITITEGRDFRPTDQYCYIFNEAARRQYDKLNLGTTLAGQNIIGFCADIKFADIHKEVVPMAFFLSDTWFNYIVVRIREGITMDDALQAIRDYARPLVPDRDIEVMSQFDVMDITYAEDAKQLKSLLIFCALAIFICMTSVFGLVVFECEYRRKEIGIRKVMGAITSEIIAMLCRRYAWILAVSFTIAAPVAWYAVDQWLQGFAYRTEILAWTFIVPLLTVAAVTFLTVAIQSYRTANANPVDSLHAE